MEDHGATTARDAISESLYDVDASDPRSELVDRSGLPAADVAQIGRLMRAFSHLREVESAASEASQRYMKLSAQDMRAVHYLIVAQNQGELVTPGMLASHLRISAASTTKLLNRLEKGGHIVRQVHPTDRRGDARDRAFGVRDCGAASVPAVPRRRAPHGRRTRDRDSLP